MARAAKMGVFSDIAFCVFLSLWLHNVTSAYYQDSCTTKTKLGKVVSVSTAMGELVKGSPVDVSLRMRTPFKPKATWTLGKTVERYEDEYYNGYNIPVQEKDTGSIRAKTESEGRDTYSFTLHLDSFDEEDIYFSLQLDHPCNAIIIEGYVDSWLNMTNVDLPTALSVPRPFIDLSAKTDARIKVGMEVNGPLEVFRSYSYFRNVRKNGILNMRNGGGSMDPIRIKFLSGSRRAQSRMDLFGKRVDGVMVLTKRPEKIGDLEAMSLLTEANLDFSGQGGGWQMGLRIGAMTQVKLRDHEARPAIGIISHQWHASFLTPKDEHLANIGFVDYDGTTIIPYIQDGNLKVPYVFQCFAEAGEQHPYVAVAVNGMNKGVVLDPLASLESPGWMSGIYEAPLQNDKKADFICSAAVGDVVTSRVFRIMVIEPVETATDIKDVVPLDEETFSDGFAFGCKAVGDPTPTITFFKQDKYSIGHPPPARELVEGNYYNGEEIKDSDRFHITSIEGQAILNVTPGSSPYPYDDEAFRLVCVGANQFTVDAAYVEFVSPNFNLTSNMYY